MAFVEFGISLRALIHPHLRDGPVPELESKGVLFPRLRVAWNQWGEYIRSFAARLDATGGDSRKLLEEYTIAQVMCYKERPRPSSVASSLSYSMHEYVLTEILGPNDLQIALLRFDRTRGDLYPHDMPTELRQSSSDTTSDITAVESPEPPHRDGIFPATAEGEGKLYAVDTVMKDVVRKSDTLLRTVTFLPHTRPRLSDLPILMLTLHQHNELYVLLEHQSLWHADMFCSVLEKVFKGINQLRRRWNTTVEWNELAAVQRTFYREEREWSPLSRPNLEEKRILDLELLCEDFLTRRHAFSKELEDWETAGERERSMGVLLKETAESELALEMLRREMVEREQILGTLRKQRAEIYVVPEAMDISGSYSKGHCYDKIAQES